MGRTADWHPKKRLGQGLVVERDGQLGYAKSDSIEVEI
jgi:hypothetical protein